ncbi:MAG: sensor histidine kinase [Lachnospiraceae bacterium]
MLWSTVWTDGNNKRQAAMIEEDKMNWVKTRETVFFMMKYLNLIIIFSISMILYITTIKIADSYNARSFLEQFSALPSIPERIPIVTFLCCGILFLVMKLRTRKYMQEQVAGIVLLELALTAMIIYYINFSYNGIILLVVVSLITELKENESKIATILLAVILFLILDYNVCGHFLHMVSFEEYLTYYQSSVQNGILVIKNILTSANYILFIIYITLLLREEIFEREHIQLLNETLCDMNEKLQNANDELEKYAKETVIMTQTKERNRLAREIHDTLGHTLTGIIAGIDACIATISIAPDITKQQLEVISDVARQGMKEVRRSVNALRPDVLEQGGLLGAILKMIDETKLTTNANIVLSNHIKTLKFNEDEEDVIYRIIQESVTNAIRHGKAQNITITMEREYSIVHIIIKDDGIGATKIKEGFGLHHMQERIALLKGEIEYDGSCGFTVKAKIPIRWGENYD